MLKKPLWKNVDILGIGAIRVALKCLAWTLELWIFQVDSVPLHHWSSWRPSQRKQLSLFFTPYRWPEDRDCLKLLRWGDHIWEPAWLLFVCVWWTCWSSLSVATPVRVVQDISQEFMCLSKPEWRKRVSSGMCWLEKGVLYVHSVCTHTLTHKSCSFQSTVYLWLWPQSIPGNSVIK